MKKAFSLALISIISLLYTGKFWNSQLEIIGRGDIMELFIAIVASVAPIVLVLRILLQYRADRKNADGNELAKNHRIKDSFQRLKQRVLYFLPWIIFLGGTTLISVGLYVAFYWRNLEKLVAEYGVFGLAMRVIFAIFAAIGLFNLITGVILTIEKIDNTFGSKAKTWTVAYVLFTILGFLAVKLLL